MIDWLEETDLPHFPDTKQALDDPNGLLAAGGKLSPTWLDQAYRRGIFPWNDPAEVRLWWSPAPRAVITRESFRIPRTVRKLIKRLNSPGIQSTVTLNLAFDAVIDSCSEPRSYEDGTWIDDDILHAYKRMHRCGRALSIELWNEQGELAGGCYGLTKGNVFFGESMFSRQPNASKMAFALAAQKLFEAGMEIIDCQMYTDHLAQFGAREIERQEFETLLKLHQKGTTNKCLAKVVESAL